MLIEKLLFDTLILDFLTGQRQKGPLSDATPPRAAEAPRVSPKPYARSWATRPPTVYRPASAIPLSETCAASETRRVARLRAASCATPASLPFRRARTARRRRGGESRRVFRARRGWRRAGSSRGADAEAKASGSIHLAEPRRRDARKSSKRAAPRAAASARGRSATGGASGASPKSPLRFRRCSDRNLCQRLLGIRKESRQVVPKIRDKQW